MAAISWQPLCYKQIPVFTQNFQEKISLFLQIHMKKKLVVETTALPITTTRRDFYPLVDIILYYLKTLKSYWRSWIHFASPINTWTVCIHYSNIDSFEMSIAKSGQVLDNVQRAVDFNHWNKGVDRMPSIAKKRLSRKKFRKHLFSTFQETKTTQTSSSEFAEWDEKVDETKFELEVIKTVDCFRHGHSNYDSKLVTFKKII